MSKFYKLQVIEIISETENCITLLFDVPEDIKNEFTYVPGQYLTIKADIDGNEVRRAYSICTESNSGTLGLSVKRVENGRMSNHLNSNVKKGDFLEIMKPDGRFTLIVEPDSQRNHYFFAAGSGITPVMSMIQSLLEQEPKSSAYLMYGNKDEDNIIFKTKLRKMEKLYTGQLFVEMTLTTPKKQNASSLLGKLGRKTADWNGLEGRIDSAKVSAFVQKNPTDPKTTEYYICGPGDMIDTVRTTLLVNGAQNNNIHFESFGNGNTDNIQIVSAVENASLKVTFLGKEIHINIPKNKNILDTLLDAGHEIPYSCTSGSCGKCVAKITTGSVEMEECFALEDSEVKEGYILTCQSHPTSERVTIIFETD